MYNYTKKNQRHILKQQYISYNEAIEFFQKASKDFPEFIQVQSIGKSWEKRDIILVTITLDVKNHANKPALFYTGTIHAREWIGIELAVGFTKYILEQLEFNPQISAIFNFATLYMIPCANPDGFEFSKKHFSFWRKNRRQNLDGSYGVDLNRNFSIGFKESKNPKSNIYSGPHPFSEPETKAIKEFVDSHNNITIALDYHSQGNVFFPAHNFKHEDTIDTTDMNTLCANMAEEIRKISGREYGIHQGKPPAKLISGSGREYYYSKNIIASVVEVGTRNISDYQENMLEHVNEHIPALLYALSEVNNYDSKNLKRVEEFQVDFIGVNEVGLRWDYKDENVYFEIYRSKKAKDHTKESNLVGITKNKHFIDKNLESATKYYYKIRAVKNYIKSPFAPMLKIKTLNDREEFSKEIYATASKTGYLSEKSKINKNHFGVNSLFVGISEKKGVCISVLNFSLKNVPKNAIIKSAKIMLYPINRVSATIEKYGEWNVTTEDIYDFKKMNQAKVIEYVGRPTKSEHLTQGIWREWKFSHLECEILQERIKNDEVYFLVDGPKKLMIDRNSQLMQWDIGYGKFGYGLNFRPKLEITYTLPENRIEIGAYLSSTILPKETTKNKLSCGFDKDGKKIYGYIEFDTSLLPPLENLMPLRVFLNLKSKNIKTNKDIRVHIEFIDKEHRTYETIKSRETIEQIGFEKSIGELKEESEHNFFFDSFSIETLERFWKSRKKISFVLKPTTSLKLLKNSVINFISNEHNPRLKIDFITKNTKAPKCVENLKLSIENGVIKITWKNPNDKSFVGVRVVKNPFRIPISPYDGQKIYGGRDEYTYDTFGSIDEDKYFAVFAYDNVPNFSKPVWIRYKGK